MLHIGPILSSESRPKIFVDFFEEWAPFLEQLAFFRRKWRAHQQSSSKLLTTYKVMVGLRSRWQWHREWLIAIDALHLRACSVLGMTWYLWLATTLGGHPVTNDLCLRVSCDDYMIDLPIELRACQDANPVGRQECRNCLRCLRHHLTWISGTYTLASMWWARLDLAQIGPGWPRLAQGLVVRLTWPDLTWLHGRNTCALA